MQNALADIYDRFAATYDKQRDLFDMGGVLADFHTRVGQTQGCLLDMGCGAGEPFARYFLEQGWRVTGVDFSPGMLRLAARYVPGMHRVCCDMRDVSFPPAIFDAVTAIYSLFHVPARDHAALFRWVHRWLKPDGLFLFTYATREYTGSDTFEGYKEFMGEAVLQPLRP